MNTKDFPSRAKYLKSEIKKIKKTLTGMPDGSIYSKAYGKTVKWYFYHDKKCKYLPKKERAKAEKLAAKKYLKLRLSEFENELRGIEAYNKHIGNPKKTSEKLLINTDYHDLLQAYFKPESKTYDEWSKAEYPTNPYLTDNKIHKSISGHLLRSKSESIIDMLLFQNKIPFRYEFLLELEGKQVYPDFTIIHPVTGEIFYWEHCGLIDDEEYRMHFLEKLDLYIRNGIYPHKNLILTFETKEKPLTSDDVMCKIEWLLSNH